MASQYGGNIKYGIEFTPIGTGLNSVKSSLNQIHTLANNLFKGINPQGLNLTKQQIQESITAVNQLEMAFTKAFNPQLGTINLQTFNNAIANSGTTLSQIQAKMAQLGTSGTTAFRSITAELLTTNMRMKETSTLMTKMRDTFANTLRWTLASTAINSVTSSVRKAYSYTKELDKSLNNIMIVTDKSADNMASFARQANKAAKELGATTTEYTNASLIYYQQGLSDAETAARTEVTLKAANVTKQSADAVSEQLTAVWNGYKVSAQETEKYIDKLAAVAATTASDLEELSVGMSRVASAANIMGVDVDQLNAQLSTIISVTREAPETIGTSLKTIFARMSDIEAGLDEDTTLGEYTQGMASLGFNVLDTNDKLRDMGDVIEEIGGKWGSLSREQQVSLAQTMAGTRQYSRLLALFDNWGMYEKALKTSQGSLGTLQKQQDIYMGSMEAHLDQLKAATEGLYSSLFESDSLNSWITGFTKFIELFDNFVQGIGGGGNVLQGLLTSLMFMFSTKIATGIANMSGNMQAATQESFRLVESQKLLNSLQSTNDSVIQDMVAMKQKMLDLNHVMNDSERNLSDSLIKELDIQSRITEEVKEKQALLNQTVQSQTGKTFTGTNQDEINTILKQKEGSIKTLISSRGGLLESLTSDFNKGVRDNSKTFNLRTSEAQAQSKVQKAQNIYETEKGIFDKKYANIVLTKQGLPNKQYKGVDDNFINQYLKDKAKLDNMQEQVSQKEQAAAGLSQKLSKNLFNIQDVSQIQQARAALTEFQQGMQGVLKTSPEMSDALIKVNRSLDAYEVAVAKGGKGSSAARAAFGEVENSLKELEKHGVQALQHTQKEMGQGYNKIGQNALLTAEQIKQAHANMEQALQKRAMINNVVQIAGGISQITFGINSLRSAISALNNEDLDPFERMLQFTMGISMALPMVIKGFQGLGAALKLNGTLTGLSVKMSNARTLAVIKETGSIEAKTKAEIIEGKVRAGTMTQYEAEIALSNIATISNYKLATSSKVAAAGMKTLWASLGPIALVLAVVVAAIYVFYKALSYKTPLEKAKEKNENLKKSVEELTTAYENAKNAYEDLISTLEDYEESKTAIDVLTQGTEAWGEAIEKNNRLVLDLMSKYEGLGRYVSDINGELVISEEGLSYVKQEQEKRLQKVIIVEI